MLPVLYCSGCQHWCAVGVKVGDELLTVEDMMVSELDMIYIESILKASSSVDVTVRSLTAEAATNQRPSRPPSEHSLPSSQYNQVVEAAASSSAETSSNDGRAGKSDIDTQPADSALSSTPWSMNHDTLFLTKKVKASHTRYRALGPESIPVYR